MWDIINEFNISLKIIYDLFDGIKSDIKQNVKIKTKKEFLIYCYRVAGTVGLMMAKILKVTKKQSLKICNRSWNSYATNKYIKRCD